MKKFKLVFAIFPIFILASCVSGTSDKRLTHKISDNGFYYKIKSDDTAKLGFIAVDYSENYVFLPPYVDEYLVTELGFEPAFMSVVGDGTMYGWYNGKKIEKVYIPYSVKAIRHDYLDDVNHPHYFYYSGEVIDLKPLSYENITIYVPFNEYDLFVEKYTGEYKDNLKKANIFYDLNCDNMSAYYIDYCETDSLISYIPPVPTINDKTFIGWYIDKDCSIEWNFEENKIVDSEELRLYAKWK